ncbi:hypothetical protein CL616_01565 [archaeon]|nr:hypothetical protein [archaeon]|tara:strand:- start:167 stop:418 length:252 start_codon:yes stop_codon:yes gene_type:complete
MKYSIVLDNIKSIVEKTEGELNHNLMENLESMYWEIGFELKGSRSIHKLIEKLGKDLEINPAILEISYNYYKNHPIHCLTEGK